MSKIKVRNAIEPLVYAWANAQTPKVSIAWESVDFKPLKDNTKQPPELLPWVQVTLIPADTVSGSLCAAEYKGLLHINVFGQAGKGATLVDQLAESLAAVFHAGLNKNGVRIPRPPSVGQGRPDEDGYYMVPMRARYQLN